MTTCARAIGFPVCPSRAHPRPLRARGLLRANLPCAPGAACVSEEPEERLAAAVLPAALKTVGREAVLEKQLWKAAIKLPMYWVAAAPAMVGAGLAALGQNPLSVAQVASNLMGSAMVVAWLNLSNDAYDGETGVDATKKESLVNLTGKPRLVLTLSFLFLVGGLCLLAYSLGTANNSMSAFLLASAIGCGYLYQGPPFRWSYFGVGEPLCFIAFGPLSTIAFYLAMCPVHVPLLSIPPAAWICSAAVGVTTAIVLFCSHFHQYDGDRLAGKLSPVVRLGGGEQAAKVLPVLSSAPFLILFLGFVTGAIPLLPFLVPTVLGVPKAMELNYFAMQNYQNVDIICRLKLVALKLHSTFSLVLSASLLLTGLCI